MNVHECPSEHQLKAYLTGRLDRETHGAVDDHLDGCPACQSTADGMEGVFDGSFAGLRPGSAVEPLAEDPALRRLVECVKAFGAGASTSNGALPQSSPTELAGEVLGNYLLMEPVGAGGMGRVYKARHRLMNRLVALKVLAPELLRSAAAKARFRREVETAARLTHPNIVAAYDAGEAAGRDFLVMEYVEGQNLSDLVKRDGPLPVGRALAYLAQAARGLAFAHAAGVVHRDVKPANLLVDAAGAVKVLDMGLARLPLSGEGEGEGGLTSSGVVMGTAAFMAPEQADDTHRADERSDVYSLGCCLFYLLTGRPPYEGRTPMAILLAHRERPIPSLRQARPDCPAAGDALFRRMIARRPADRPASMTAVLAELESLQRDLPTGRTQPPCVYRRTAARLVAACLLLTMALAAVWVWVHPWRGQPLQPVAPKDDVPAAPLAVTHGDTATVVAPAERPPSSHPAPPPLPPAQPRTPAVETVRVPAGEFWMGSPDSDPDASPDEKPRRRVKITLPFLLGKFKVTQALYQDVMGANPSAFGPTGRQQNKMKGIDTGALPVESIRWLDAVAFCNRLSERHGLKPYYHVEGSTVGVNGGDGWRLPTEAEWEYACRAGTETRWCFGDDAADLGDYAWYAGNSGDIIHPVGQKKPNAWGLYDMHGDVPEWCWDRFDAGFYKHAPLIDPVGGVGATRVYRGGGWGDAAAQTRSASRQSLGAAYGILTLVGFRVARDAAP